MKNQLWGGSHKKPANQTNLLFCAGRDVQTLAAADHSLIIYDLWTNFAHSQMLEEQNIISAEEKNELHQSLRTIHQLYQKQEFQLDPEKEDVHTNIEYHITNVQNKISGKKIHIGRSRNDQVLTDMRLYARDQILNFSTDAILLIVQLLKVAKEYKGQAMPGFTHSQPAMCSSVAHWILSWSQGFIRGLKKLLRVYDSINLNPLGAVAGFGTAWNISREKTAKYLAFPKVEENTLDCVSNRGEAETAILGALSQLMNQFSLLAQDLVLLSHPYFQFFTIDVAYTTGSSIMPQKKNPDFAEVTRSKTAYCHGLLMSSLSLQKGMMSGYNRDSQMSKTLIMDAFREIELVPTIYTQILNTLTINTKKMQSQCQVGYLNAADFADWIAFQYQIPFRDSYEIVSHAVELSKEAGQITFEALNEAIELKNIVIKIQKEEFEQLNIANRLIEIKTHTGSPSSQSSQAMIESQEAELDFIKQFVVREQDRIQKAKKQFFNA